MNARWGMVAALASISVGAMCGGPDRPDPGVIERTDEVLRRYEGRDLIEVLEEYEQRLRRSQDRDPGVRLALGRVFERLYDERELLRARMAEGSLLSSYVAGRPGGSDLLAEAGWLYASVAAGRAPPNYRAAAVRGLADVFERKERDVTACVSEPLAQRSEFAWGLLRYVLLRCEIRLRVDAGRAGDADREGLRRALERTMERARLLRADPAAGPTFQAFFREAEESARRAAESADPLESLAHEAGFGALSLDRHIEAGLNAKEAATELRLAQADPVGIFHQYERSLEHLVFAVEAMCRLHGHEGAPSARKREHVMETLEAVLAIAEEMIYRR